MNLKIYGASPIQSDIEKTILEKYASGSKEESLLSLAMRQKDMELIDVLTLRKHRKMCCVRYLYWLIYHNTLKNMERNQAALDELRERWLEIRQDNRPISFNSLDHFYGEMFSVFFDYYGKMRTESYLSPFEMECYWNRFIKDYETSAWEDLYANII